MAAVLSGGCRLGCAAGVRTWTVASVEHLEAFNGPDDAGNVRLNVVKALYVCLYNQIVTCSSNLKVSRPCCLSPGHLGSMLPMQWWRHEAGTRYSMSP